MSRLSSVPARVVAGLVLAAVTGCAGGDSPARSPLPTASSAGGVTSRPEADPVLPPTVTETPSSEQEVGYSRRRTVHCLRERGAEVGTVRAWDDRRQALADLAQDNSVEVRRRGANVLMAFTESPAAAQFLVEALTVPDDPYRLEAQGSVVLLYRPGASGQARATESCLG